MDIFKNRPFHESMRNAFNSLYALVKPLNYEREYCFIEIGQLDHNLGNLQNQLKIGLNKFTPYCHWILYIRAAIQIDDVFGLFSSSRE